MTGMLGKRIFGLFMANYGLGRNSDHLENYHLTNDHSFTFLQYPGC